MITVIKEIGPSKVFAICTDNAANMRRAWEIVQVEFKHIHAYGCLAHVLNLVIGDISKIPSVEQAIKQVTSVAKTVKASSKLTALLKECQSGDCEKTLKLPVSTR